MILHIHIGIAVFRIYIWCIEFLANLSHLLMNLFISHVEIHINADLIKRILLLLYLFWSVKKDIIHGMSNFYVMYLLVVGCWGIPKLSCLGQFSSLADEFCFVHNCMVQY